MKRKLLRIALCAAAFLAVYNAAVYWVMAAGPTAISAVMKYLPTPALLLTPFPLLWSHARAGSLTPGSPAPDFHLERADRSGHVRLSDARGRRPVVLVFGSYT